MADTLQDQLIHFIRISNKILIFTGAGISTGSGISDYHGPQGVWKRRKPVYYQDFMSSHEARVEYWDYKIEGWESFRTAKPNAVHFSSVQFEQAGKLLMVVTQNIDGLHSLACTSLERLIELHGTNSKVECQRCHVLSDPESHFAYFKETHLPPLCKCGGFLKPATISFGQNLNMDDLKKAETAAKEADLVIALGSTLSVYHAATIPVIAAKRCVPYVIINQGQTDQDGHPAVSLRIEGNVVEIFPLAVSAALREIQS